MAPFVHLLKEGAPYSWIVIALFAIGLVAFVTLSVLTHRRLLRPSWTLFIAPLLVVLAGFGGMGLVIRKVDRIVLAHQDALGMRALLFAQGRSEALSVAIVGTVAGTILLSLSGVVVGARALRQGHREVTGRAITAGLVTAIVAGIALVLRRVLLVKAGAHVSFMTLPAGIVLATSLLAALIIFFAASSIPEWADEEDERAAASDVATALSFALTSVLAALVAGALLHWRLRLGAAGGASVDPVERGGILHTGNAEARALVYAAVAALSAVVIGIAIAIVPRVKVVGRGALKAAPAITAALVLTLLPSIVTNITTQRSIARLREIDELSWPKDVEAAFVDARTNNLGPVLGAALFVKGDRVWFEGNVKKVSLVDPKACSDAVQQAPVAAIANKPLAIGVDKTTTIANMHCLALAAAERRWAMLAEGTKPANDEVAWLVRIKVERGRAGSDQYTSTTRPMGATSLTELSAAALRVHVTKTGWELQRRGANVERGEGNALPPATLPDKSLVLLTASPDVTAERLLPMLGSIPANTQLLLGPPSRGLRDEDDTLAPLKAVPRSGFGSEIIWETSTALAQDDADVIESKLQEAISKCAATAGAATLTLSFTFEKIGETSIIPSPADMRGSCFADALSNLHLGARETVATATIVLGELHVTRLPAGIAKRPTKPPPPKKPPPKKPPPRKK